MSRRFGSAIGGIRVARFAATISFAAVWLAGCGHYGPPVRSAQPSPTKPAAVNETDTSTASHQTPEDERDRKRADQEPTP